MFFEGSEKKVEVVVSELAPSLRSLGKITGATLSLKQTRRYSLPYPTSNVTPISCPNQVYSYGIIIL